MPIGAFKLNGIGRYLPPSGRTAKIVTSVGSATTSSTQTKFGATSLLLNQPAGHKYLQSTSTGFALGSGNFTVEYWWRASTYPASNKRWIDWGYTTANAPLLFTGNSNTRQLQWFRGNGGGGVTQICATGTTDLPATGTWAHVAIVRNSNTTKIYIDGVEKATSATGADTTNYAYGGTFRIGFDASGVADTGIDGYIDELRISSIARYTTAFTPSSSAFTNDSNTILLLHMNGTNGGTTFTDDNA